VDSTVIEGNDAILHCVYGEDIYRVSSWVSDDGLIFLPLTTSNNALGKNKTKQNLFSPFQD